MEGTLHALASTRLHPGLLLSVVELASGPDLPADAAPTPAPEADWLSASALDLNAVWDEPTAPPALAGDPPLAGRPLHGYMPVTLLGRGSHAEVWQAVRDAPEMKVVALKILRGPSAARPDRRKRFQREAALTRRFGGDGILPAEEVGEADGAIYIVFPFVPGASLAQVIARRRQRAETDLPVATVDAWWDQVDDEQFSWAMVRVLARIARTVARLHAQRVVHRDIKPANILLDATSEENAYLGDLGLSVDLDDPAGAFDESSGTPMYTAPEKLLGRAGDEVRCDLYSLGATLYEAVTQVHPVPLSIGLSRSSLADYLARVEANDPRAVRPGLPPLLAAILRKAAHPDPNHRYASAAALADHLDECLRRLAPAAFALDLDPDHAQQEPRRRQIRGDVAKPAVSRHRHHQEAPAARKRLAWFSEIGW
jgi:serine/threonine protein kinase